MPARSEKPASERGYALITVVVVTVLILTGAAILVVSSKETEIAGQKEKLETEAYGVAMAGLQYMYATMDNRTGKNNCTKVGAYADVTTANTPQTSLDVTGTANLFHFYADDRYGGVYADPPSIGTSDSSWTSFGNGHYAMYAVTDPINPSSSCLIRSLGVVRGAQVLLEANLNTNKLEQVPSGLTGCYSSGLYVSFKDWQGPYDYTGNTRFDGTIGVPIGLSQDNDIVNGLAKTGASSSPSTTGTTLGRHFFGTQTLRGGSLASGTQTKYGGNFGTHLITVGSAASWSNNPWKNNDPRIVDEPSTHGGLGVNADGVVWRGDGIASYAGSGSRSMPLIAFHSGPTVTSTTSPDNDPNAKFTGQSEWAGQADDTAASGLYGCYNSSGTLTDAVSHCTVGVASSATTPSWTADAVNKSGRAWNLVSTIVRQCAGSGNNINRTTGEPWYDATNNPNGIRCAAGFEWLENVAACLILPDNVQAANGTNANRGDDGVATNNFEGCHPGCLLATDMDETTASTYDDLQDMPFRSSCINLNPQRATTYGPGAITGFGTIADADTATANQQPASPPTTTFPYGDNWTNYVQSGTAANTTFPPATVNDTARFKQKDGTNTTGAGYVTERGNPNLITRFDLSDRGPLGTCEQNCLAYGFGKDRTYGAHRTDLNSGNGGTAATTSDVKCKAYVPNTSGGFSAVACNYDYDGDGNLDRKSYALSSSYVEECADPGTGMPYVPAYNLASGNTAITTAGCTNQLPNFGSNEGATITQYCDGSDEELEAAVAALEAQASTISTSDLSDNNTPDANSGWWGGAKCHMGSYSVGVTHPHNGNATGIPDDDTDIWGRPDYWIEDDCPDPKIVKLGTNADISTGNVCGCGILILEENSMKMTDGAFLWRGIVLFNYKNASGAKDVEFKNTGGQQKATFIIEGAMLMTGNISMKWIADKPNGGNATSISNPGSSQDTLKYMFRLNENAISDALSAFKKPPRSFRRLR